MTFGTMFLLAMVFGLFVMGFADMVKLVRKKGDKVQSADVPKSEVPGYLAGGWLPEGEADFEDDDGGGDNDDAIAAVKKMKKAELEAFVDERGLPIDLSDFSNMDERRAAVIAVLEADSDEG